LFFSAIEGAELAARNADIGVIDVLIDDVVRGPAMAPQANVIRQCTNRHQIGVSEERQAVVATEALSRKNLRLDITETARNDALLLKWSHLPPAIEQSVPHMAQPPSS
jgi:hypothetical protein